MIFCFLYFQVRNNQNRSEKCQKFEKILTYKWWRHFEKISAKCTNFEAWSLGIEFQVSVSEFLMKSRSRSFNQVSV